MAQCKLGGSDYDRQVIEVNDPGDEITYQGERYRRLVIDGIPHVDGLGQLTYQWIYPVRGDWETAIGGRKAP